MRPEVNYKKKTRTITNMWLLNKVILNNQCFNEEIKREIKKCLDISENGTATYQNVWDTAKAVLRGKLW